jgi:hypothetical protein
MDARRDSDDTMDAMARSSTLTDDVDPGPRLLRLLASSLIASGEPVGRRIARRLRRDADVLEGATMTAAESNRPHSRMLARERRVRPVRDKARSVMVGKAPTKRMPHVELLQFVDRLRDGTARLEDIKNDEDREGARIRFDDGLVRQAKCAAGGGWYWDSKIASAAALFLPWLRVNDAEAQRMWVARPRPSTPEWRASVEEHFSKLGAPVVPVEGPTPRE